MGHDARRINGLAGKTGHSPSGVWQPDWSDQTAPQPAPAGALIAAWLLPPPPQPDLVRHAAPLPAQAQPLAASAPPQPAADPAPVAAVAPVADSAFGALAVALQAAALPATSTPAYPALYVFGGSLSDVGNQFTLNGGHIPAPPYYEGRFSNGPLWIEDYAAHFGMPDPVASLLGGTDFAVGGARSGATDLAGTGNDLPQQFAAFAAQVPTPVAGALYTVETGGNDLIAIVSSGASMATMQAMVDQSVQADIAFIGDLASRGAVNFLVPNTGDLGQAPKFAGTALAADATSLTTYFNAELSNALVNVAITDHLNIDNVDVFSLDNQAVASPAAFGFTNVTDPLWSGNAANAHSGALATNSAAGQSQYLFWDALHPTAAGQALMAAAAENVVFR